MADDHVAAVEALPTSADDARAMAARSPGTRGRRSGQALPFNSRRLTAPLLRQMATGLGVPSAAPAGDLRPIIEGKLTEAGHDPLRTQVVLREVEGGTHIDLQDEMGVFVEIEPPEPESPPAVESDREEDDTDVAAFKAEIEQLRRELDEHKGRTREMWRMNCEQVAELDALLSEKEDKNARLKEEIARLNASSPSVISEGLRLSNEEELGGHSRGVSGRTSSARRGKALPVDTFSGGDPECHFEDWLPALKRAADWNGWSGADFLLQLAGHLKGRALQEWNLLPDDQKTTYDCAVAAL